LFFLLGSLGYLVTACTAYVHKFPYETNVLNIILAAIFILDSLFYLFALIWSKYSVVSMKHTIKCPFHSRIDIYLIATLLYIAGSVVYLVQSVQVYLRQDSSVSNLLAACIFMVDAPLYVASVFHERNEDNELGFLLRRNIFIIDEVTYDRNEFKTTASEIAVYVTVDTLSESNT